MGLHYLFARPPAPDLGDLLAGIRFGDRMALGSFYDATVGRVYALALRITRNPVDAEEATCNTYVRVWREADRFDDARGSADAWLMTLCRAIALGCSDGKNVIAVRAGTFAPPPSPERQHAMRDCVLQRADAARRTER